MQGEFDLLPSATLFGELRLCRLIVFGTSNTDDAPLKCRHACFTTRLLCWKV